MHGLIQFHLPTTRIVSAGSLPPIGFSCPSPTPADAWPHHPFSWILSPVGSRRASSRLGATWHPRRMGARLASSRLGTQPPSTESGRWLERADRRTIRQEAQGSSSLSTAPTHHELTFNSFTHHGIIGLTTLGLQVTLIELSPHTSRHLSACNSSI